MQEFEKIYSKPKSILPEFTLKDSDQISTTYCSGCGHGIVHRILGTVIDDLGIKNDVVMVNSVGCSVFLYYYFDCDHVGAPHGRACAVATGVKRYLPDRIILTYQGDGDLAAIGANETLHAAKRGETISVIFVNNTTYGMTGNQLAPTTLPGQVTTTTPYGCNPNDTGMPFKISEMLALLPGTSYIERVALYDVKRIKKTEKAIKKLLTNQIEGKGFGLVEVLAPCPTSWKTTPVNAMKHIKENVTKYFPLGVIKNENGINKEMVCGGP